MKDIKKKCFPRSQLSFSNLLSNPLGMFGQISTEAMTNLADEIDMDVE